MFYLEVTVEMREEDFYNKIKNALKEKTILERKDIDELFSHESSPSKHHIDYTIVKTPDGDIYEISTVFLDYWGKIGRFGVEGEPIRNLDKMLEINPEAKPYETMVFKLEDQDKLHLIKFHYDSKENAQKGHKIITKLIWEQGPDLVKKLKLSENKEWWRKYE